MNKIISGSCHLLNDISSAVIPYIANLVTFFEVENRWKYHLTGKRVKKEKYHYVLRLYTMI